MNTPIDLNDLPTAYSVEEGKKADGKFFDAMLYEADPNGDGVIEEGEQDAVVKFLTPLDSQKGDFANDGILTKHEALASINAEITKLSTALGEQKSLGRMADPDVIDDLDDEIDDLRYDYMNISRLTD